MPTRGVTVAIASLLIAVGCRASDGGSEARSSESEPVATSDPAGALIWFVDGTATWPPPTTVTTMERGIDTPITPPGGPRSVDWDWSPDLTHAIWMQEIADDPGAFLRLGGIDGSDPVTIDTLGSSLDFRGRAFSNDGTRFAYAVFTDDGTDLRVIDVAAPRPSTVAHWEDTGDVDVDWSPDGSQLVVGVASGGTRGGIFTMRPDGSDVVRISGLHAWRVAWSPAGPFRRCRRLGDHRRCRGHLRHGRRRLERQAALTAGHRRDPTRLVTRWRMDRVRESPRSAGHHAEGHARPAAIRNRHLHQCGRTAAMCAGSRRRRPMSVGQRSGPGCRRRRNAAGSHVDHGTRPKMVLGAPEPCRFLGPPITIHPPVAGMAPRFVRFSSVKRWLRSVSHVSRNSGSLPGIRTERVGAERAAPPEDPLLDQPLHGRLREAGLTELPVGAAAVVIRRPVGTDRRAPPTVASRPQEDRRFLREPAVLLGPGLERGHRQLVVDVLLHACAHVDHDRGQDEVARVELVGAPGVHVEVARRAVVRARVLALLHVLQIEPVLGHREGRRHRESRIAGEHRCLDRIVRMRQEDDLREPRQRGAIRSSHRRVRGRPHDVPDRSGQHHAPTTATTILRPRMAPPLARRQGAIIARRRRRR